MICALRPWCFTLYIKPIIGLYFIMQILLQGQALGQSRGLVAPQTIAGVEFIMRAAGLDMIPPVTGYSPVPTARFSIAVTNRNKSSIGLLIDPGPSGASTDTDLDLKLYNHNIERGFRTCSPCKDVPDSEWVVLQPDQTNNVIVGFWTRIPEYQKHRKAEAADLTLIVLVKQGSGETTQAVLSWADIPIRNEIQ